MAGFLTPPPRRAGPAERACADAEYAFLQGHSLGGMLPVETLEAQIAAMPLDLQAFVWEGVGAALSERPMELEQLRTPLRSPFLDVGAGIATAVAGGKPPSGWRQEGFGFGIALFRGRQLYSFPVSPAFDHGVGRALWFLSGGEPAQARRLVRSSPPESQAWRWRGLGLAAIFTGGGAEHRVELLRLGASPLGSWVEEGARQGRALRILWRGGAATSGPWPWDFSGG